MMRVLVFVVCLSLVAGACSAVPDSTQTPPRVSIYPLENQWLADSRTGCRVRDAARWLHKSVTWSGPCQNGVAQGKGVLTFANGDRYEGEFRDGLYNGKGVLTFANGDERNGDFKGGHFILGYGSASLIGNTIVRDDATGNFTNNHNPHKTNSTEVIDPAGAVLDRGGYVPMFEVWFI